MSDLKLFRAYVGQKLNFRLGALTNGRMKIRQISQTHVILRLFMLQKTYDRFRPYFVSAFPWAQNEQQYAPSEKILKQFPLLPLSLLLKAHFLTILVPGSGCSTAVEHLAVEQNS